jgi:hypothetical protein
MPIVDILQACIGAYLYRSICPVKCISRDGIESILSHLRRIQREHQSKELSSELRLFLTVLEVTRCLFHRFVRYDRQGDVVQMLWSEMDMVNALKHCS